MIISKLNGGIGNQMFQYALGRHLAYLNNTDLKLDISSLSDNKSTVTSPLRKYELDAFNIKSQIASQNDLSVFSPGELITDKIIKRIKYSFGLLHVVNQTGLGFQSSVLSLRSNIYLNGYWQSEKYFLPISHLIKNDFTLKNTNLEHLREYRILIDETQSVSIHFRRGDYINDLHTNSIHGVCEKDYYLNAIEYIRKHVKSTHFFVFSDDMPWVKENFFTSYPVTFVINKHPEKCYEELYLMSLCKHNIIANSSFSWWGAWLNNNPDKIVISPRIWFANENLNTKTNDLIPQNWIRL